MLDTRTIAKRLTAAARGAGLPIAGVSIGTADRSTWRVQLLDTATDDDRLRAAQLVDVVDLEAAAFVGPELVKQAAAQFDAPALQALIAVFARELRVLGSRLTAADLQAQAVDAFVAAGTARPQANTRKP